MCRMLLTLIVMYVTCYISWRCFDDATCNTGAWSRELLQPTKPAFCLCSYLRNCPVTKPDDVMVQVTMCKCCRTFTVFFFFFCGERSRSRCYGRTAISLEAYCATLWWRWLVVSFFRVMEHRCDEVDRGKPKYSGKKLAPVPLCLPQIPHGLTRDRTWASAVRGRRLTALAMARPRSQLLVVNVTASRNLLHSVGHLRQPSWSTDRFVHFFFFFYLTFTFNKSSYCLHVLCSHFLILIRVLSLLGSANLCLNFAPNIIFSVYMHEIFRK
jgi:hypothetical protein